MTLEKINDDLVEFLPYEIDDTYIEKLFSDITSLKIRSNCSNYLYSKVRDLSYFEEYLSNIVQFDLESNEKEYKYSVDFAEKLSKKKKTEVMKINYMNKKRLF